MHRILLSLLLAGVASATQPEVAEITFDGRAQTNWPTWVVSVQQEGGQFSGDPACWQVEAGQPPAAGRLFIVLDRQKLSGDLAMSLLYDEVADADVAVQLFDVENRAVVLDLFGNLMAVGREAKTDTFIVPLQKYPTATKIVIRQIRGVVRVYGAALFPVATEAEADLETLQELAKLLGDPLSPENPLVKGINQIANSRGVAQKWLPSPDQSPTIQPKQSGSSHGTHTWGALDWFVMPFPVDCDWPGPKGERARWVGQELILHGQPVRTRRTFGGPVTVKFETNFEARDSSDGSIQIHLEPPGMTLDRQGDRAVAFAVGYENHAGRGHDTVAVNWRDWRQTDRVQRGRELLRMRNLDLDPDKWHTIQIEVTNRGARLTVNGQTYDLPELHVPYAQFHVTLYGWQPTNRWHIRNFSVH